MKASTKLSRLKRKCPEQATAIEAIKIMVAEQELTIKNEIATMNDFRTLEGELASANCALSVIRDKAIACGDSVEKKIALIAQLIKEGRSWIC